MGTDFDAGTAIAVVGATGHTGRFVTSELRRRGAEVVALGRDLGSLVSAGFDTERTCRVVDVSDVASIADALEGAAAVINCAGPFFDTASNVIEAALRSGTHYLDVAPEQAVVRSVFEGFEEKARGAGVAVLPAAAFYGGLADLLATAVAPLGEIDEIVVAVGLDSWHPTRGTRLTGERNVVPRVVVRNGFLVEPDAVSEPKRWDFPSPIGSRQVVGLPLSEIITISSHLDAGRIDSVMNLEPLDDLRDAETPPPLPIDGLGRSAQTFAMEVVVSSGGKRRRATAVGQDIYFVSAPIVVEAAARLVSGTTASPVGVHALGSAFDARSFLDSFDEEVMRISYSRVENVMLQKDGIDA